MTESFPPQDPLEDAIREAALQALTVGAAAKVRLPGRSEFAWVVPDVDLALALIEVESPDQPPFPRLDFPDGRAVYLAAVDADDDILTSLHDVVAYLAGRPRGQRRQDDHVTRATESSPRKGVDRGWPERTIHAQPRGRRPPPRIA